MSDVVKRRSSSFKITKTPFSLKRMDTPPKLTEEPKVRISPRPCETCGAEATAQVVEVNKGSTRLYTLRCQTCSENISKLSLSGEL